MLLFSGSKLVPISRRGFLWSMTATGATVCGIYALNRYRQTGGSKHDNTKMQHNGNHTGTTDGTARNPSEGNGNGTGNVAISPSDKWSRPYYRAGGGDAFVLYTVFGDFAQPLSLRGTAHCRFNGLPDGVKLVAYTRADHDKFIEACYGGWLRKSLKAEQPDLFAAVEHAPMCLILRGTVADPPTLSYLRDVVGVVTALLDKGAVAVLDSQAFAWFAPQQWRERISAPEAPVPTHHVTVLLSQGHDGTHVWLHTRGMRKFGRPDLSVRGVTPKHQDAYIELCNRFIEMQAFGEVVPEGQSIRMRGLPPGMVCHHQGDYDDLDFNNVHIEIQMPK